MKSKSGEIFQVLFFFNTLWFVHHPCILLSLLDLGPACEYENRGSYLYGGPENLMWISSDIRSFHIMYLMH